MHLALVCSKNPESIKRPQAANSNQISRLIAGNKFIKLVQAIASEYVPCLF